jgi:carbon storage regulator CsrA
MLVLSRKLDQDIVIGDNIRIRVLKIKGNTIRLGVEAPRDIKVMRGELTAAELDREPTVVEESEPPKFAPQVVAAPAAIEAEVTVVFSNENANRQQSRHQLDLDRNSHSNSSDNRVLPFQRADEARENTANANPRNANFSADDSVRFRAPLPMSLQHNRLKELVKELTRGNP